MARQSETYHIDLINRELEGERQYRGAISPKPRYNTNMADILIQNLLGQVHQGINLGETPVGKFPEINIPTIKELSPSLTFDYPVGENINIGGGVNVPTRQGMMDWLINLGIDF